MNIRDIMQLARVIPSLTLANVDQAVPLARALTAGGLRIIEVAMHGPAALLAVEAIRKAVPEAIVGISGLTRAVDFASAGRATAQFGVTPGFTTELAAAARGARFPVMPSVMTPTELTAARHGGFEVVRLFPARLAGGVEMLEVLGDQFPDVRFCAAGGITAAAAPDYLALSNVLCVSGAWMAPQALLEAGDWGGIEGLARGAAAI